MLPVSSQDSTALTALQDADLDDGAGLVGSVISERYRIEAMLGEGGMGAVYLAEHTHMRKRVAVKILHREMTQMPEIVARFEREAMAAGHIEHPNVASATDFGKLDDGSFFLVLEYVEGHALRQELSEGPLGLDRALHITKQIASALARAHSLGIVHRDLKPENVMLSPREEDPDFVKVLDFGIAKVPVAELSGEASGEALTRAGVIFGTPEYMAPEQALGEEVDHRADLYALGILLYEMLSGSRPFEADSAVSLLGMQVTQPPPPLSSEVPPAIAAIVMRLLAKEAGDRFQQAREVIEAIDEVSAAPRATSSSQAIRRESLIDALRTPLSWFHPIRQWAATQRLPWIEPIRRQLPPKLAALSHVTLLSIFVGTLTALLLLVSLTTSSKGADGEAVKAEGGGLLSLIKMSSKASAEELSRAKGEGADALAELVEKYPEDIEPLRALAALRLESEEPLLAMEAASRMLTLEPALREDADIQQLVMEGARSSEAREEAFTLLEGPFEALGVDLLYDLATTKGTPSQVVIRANRYLRSKEAREKASPAMGIILDLRGASGCAARKALLPQAEEHGDERVLPLLRSLTRTTGCGLAKRSDCYPCLRDGSLITAIRAIEGRTKEEGE